MSTLAESGRPLSLRSGLDALHRHWYWYLILGILLVVVGMAAIASPFIYTITTVLFFGWLMIFGGITELVGSFWARYWSGTFGAIVIGLLHLFVGVFAIRHPLEASVWLTLLIAAMISVGGIFRIILAVQLRYHGWGWSVLSGVISALLGLYIFATEPVSALWVIGTLVGIDLLFHGWTWIALALAVKSRPVGGTAA